MKKSKSLTPAQRAKIVTEISLAYLGGGDRITVALRMPKWLNKHAPGTHYPSERQMEGLVKDGKAKYRQTIADFKQGAAEFAAAVCPDEDIRPSCSSSLRQPAGPVRSPP